MLEIFRMAFQRVTLFYIVTLFYLLTRLRNETWLGLIKIKSEQSSKRFFTNNQIDKLKDLVKWFQAQDQTNY